ncbi:N-acetylgalactosamine-6-sulfatase [Mucinivorans hirudinis]|uniref:N-acetylgalactosamine-6-sulfatase n=1 Tax=Mucinivorans hirudinis TaxID=1433126 RepID=A0A060RD43_9BACT|nr:N-acetylgalactosamine-6-sulfatase [Mucinivorans hirudinis]
MKTPNLLLLAGALTLTAQAQQKRPNIILFLVDDMGWQDTSHPFYEDTTNFNRIYHTPNMERLAKMGVTFTNAYASAVSSPTRTSLMTGMYPSSHRVTNWTLRRDQSPDNISGLNSIELPSWNVNGLQPIGAGINNSVEATTLPSLLQQNGYFTIHCGKAHWGSKGTPGANPLTLGFDVNIAGFEAGGPASYLASENFGFDENGMPKNDFAIPGLEQYWGQNIFLTQALTIEATKALDRAVRENRPFYLYMSHYAIHVPLNKDDRYYQKYKDAGLDDSQARYAGLIEGMDKSLGDLMDYIEQKGVADNTIILFMSDNGGLSNHGRSGTPETHNKPLANGKGSPYEGGVRVPMIAYQPGVTRAGGRDATPINIVDFFPTILELGGVKDYKTTQKVDGISFSTILNGRGDKRFAKRAQVWHFPNRWIPFGDPRGKGYGTYSSILKEGWKLIYYYDFDYAELYNINEDIGEQRDLASDKKYAKKREALAQELTAKLKADNAQFPRSKNGTPCKYPNGEVIKN